MVPINVSLRSMPKYIVRGEKRIQQWKVAVTVNRYQGPYRTIDKCNWI